jgi:uncharacterized protein YbjT (DUF2867 family)
MSSESMIDKLVVDKSKRILVIGNSRLKIATACYLRAHFPEIQEIFAGSSDPWASKNDPMRKVGINLLHVDMSVPSTLLPAMQECRADAVFLLLPAGADRTELTISGISACKRAGVGHVVVLSTTAIDAERPSVFAEQCAPIEKFLKSSGLTYTILRIPILLDNYLSQLQSMASHGVFYRPLDPSVAHSAIAIADVAQAASHVLASPGRFADMTLSLNGCTTSCREASEAFTAAFGKPVLYEQVTYDEYAEMLLDAGIPSHQVDGNLQLFRLMETQDACCAGSSHVLRQILDRPPYDVTQFARQIVGKLRCGNVDRAIKAVYSSLSSIEDVDETNTGECEDNLAQFPFSPWTVSVNRERGWDRHPAGLTAMMEVEYGLGTDSSAECDDNDDEGDTQCQLVVTTSTDSSRTIDLNERILSATRLEGKDGQESDRESSKQAMQQLLAEDADAASEKQPATVSDTGRSFRNAGTKMCILLDGVLTIVPTSSVEHTHTRTLGSLDNQSFDLRDYALHRRSATRLALLPRAERTPCSKHGEVDEARAGAVVLGLHDADDCTRWYDTLTIHRAYQDRKSELASSRTS